MKLWMAPVMAALIGLAVTYALGFIVIPFMHKLKFGQTILDIGPSWHKKKQGTPTMGGFMFVGGFAVALTVVICVFKAIGLDVISWNSDVDRESMYIKLFAGIIMSVGFCLIGFVDDYIKVAKHRNLGLTEMQKTLFQLIVIAFFLATVDHANQSGCVVPYSQSMLESRVFFWIVGFIAIYCTVNAANFTDGIDGLCSSVSSVMCIGFGVCAFMMQFKGLSVVAAALFGALIGFYIKNRNPAAIIMGDMGSMFIGGMMCTFAYCLNAPWLIIPICFIYVLNFAVDVIQIVYSITHRGKKLFKMAPLHHHYEQCGWSEKKICRVFSAISVLTGAAAVALVYFGVYLYRV